MGTHISWLQEGHFILERAVGDIGVEDFKKSDSVFVEMIRAKADAAPMVHILMDLGEVAH